MEASISYIARLDLSTFLRVVARRENVALRQAFNQFCQRQELKFGENPLTFESLDQAAASDKRERAAESLLRMSIFERTAAQEEHAAELSFDLLQGLTNSTFGKVSFTDVLELIVPEFKLVGIPFGLVADTVKEVKWDPEAGVPGIWRRLEPGKFMMGAPEKQRIVGINNPFLISVFPFTNGQALGVPRGKELCGRAPIPVWNNGAMSLGDNYYREKIEYPLYVKTTYVGVGSNLNEPIPENLQLPLVGLSSEAAEHFAQLDGANLPAEEEWEYAARYEGPKQESGVVLGFPYPVGPGLLDAQGRVLAHIMGPGRKDFKYTAPVGSYPREAGSGIYDMGGNVLEWIRGGYISRGGFWSRGIGDGGEEMLATHFRHIGSSGHSTFAGFRAIINLAA